MKNRTWAEVSLESVEHNYKAFQSLAKNAAVMCVIKADAYGHGAVALGSHLQACGCGFFAVASLDEALELAKAGVTANVLVLGHVCPLRGAEALEFDNIRLTVFDAADAAELSRQGLARGKRIKVHVKIDTGMTRLGVNADVAVNFISELQRLGGIELEGMFTHFASADELDPGYTQLQFRRFMSVADELKAKAIHIPLLHVCNSAAAIMFPEMYLNMVRLGISLYGCYPSGEVDKDRISLRHALSLKTQIARVSKVPSGTPVGYGRTFTTVRDSIIATLPIGYADGLSRLMAGKLRVIIAGKEAPVVGRICMDQCMADVTDIPGVKNLDEVIIYGGTKQAGQSVERVAEAMGTNSYEIFCMIGRRVPRVYI